MVTRRVSLAALAAGALLAAATPAPATAEPGFVGLRVQGMELSIARALGLGALEGALVRDVAPGGPGDRAGFHHGDLIRTLGGVRIDTFETLIETVHGLDAGARVPVEVARHDGGRTLTLETVTWPERWRVPKASFANVPELGLTVASLTPQVRERFDVRWGTTGLAVTLVDPNRAGTVLESGDVIVQIDRRPVWLPAQLSEAYADAKRGTKDALLLLVAGRAGFRFVRLAVDPASPSAVLDGPTGTVLGMQVQGVPAEAAGLVDGRAGVLVRDVRAATGAAVAGIRRGDLVVAVAGTSVGDLDGLRRAVGGLRPGAQATIAVDRVGERHEATLTVGAPEAAAPTAAGTGTLAAVGIALAPLDAATRERYGLRWGTDGAVVSSVGDDREVDLAQGDVVFQVNQRPVAAPADVVAAYDAARGAGRRHLLLSVEGRGGFRFSLLPVR